MMINITGLINLNKIVLGMNYRNQNYIRPLNSSKSKRIADSKILCKKVMLKNNIPVSKTFKIIYSKEQLDMIDWNEIPKSFVLKPNEGTHGGGIIVFYGRKKNSLEWIKPSGDTMKVDQIKHHIYDILDGKYSMGGKKDLAFLEERIINHPILKPYCFKGIPDIRIIVCNEIPIMAMLRLPTKESDAKANLHAGGIGVGVDIATGITTTAIHHTKISIISDAYHLIEKTVDEPHLPLRGIQIPFWDEILRIAVKAQKASGLGYTGVDIAIDKLKGPLLLELNARPGLGIQIANQKGLKERLVRIEGIKVKDLDQGIKIAKTLFGGEVEEEIENISGKQIIAPIEKVKLVGKNQMKKTKKRKVEKVVEVKQVVLAKVDTGEFYSLIDHDLTQSLGYGFFVDKFSSIVSKNKKDVQEEASRLLQELQGFEELIDFEIIFEKDNYKALPIISIKTSISNVNKSINYRIRNRSKLIYPLVLGRKDLKDFLIDPSKKLIRT